jgi:glycosyltransferase involved in cell wall biosynthesis
MKIVLIGPTYPYKGGISHHNTLLGVHLKAHGNDVQSITFTRQYPKIFYPGETQVETGDVKTVHDAPPSKRLIDSVNPFNWYSVAKEVVRANPDLVIFRYWLPFFGPCFGTIAKYVKQHSSSRVMFLCDNVIPHERRPGDFAFTRYAFRNSDFFIVQSDTVEQDLLKIVPKANYKKTPHPVYEFFGASVPKSDARSKLGIQKKNVILFFGYIRKYKGLMLLLEAFRIMRDNTKNNQALSAIMGETLLLIVGEFYDGKEKYEKFVSENQLGDHLRFVSHYVPTEEVAPYFGAADVVALPYISATQSGIVQIAYNFDKPVIVTNVGGLSEIVIDGKTGYVVPPENPQALAAALERFFVEDKEAEFSTNVAIEKRKYSWDRMVETVESFMN